MCLAHSQCLLCEFLFHSLLRRSLHIRAQEYEAAMKADTSESTFQRPGQTHWAACEVDEPKTERHRWHFSESSGGLSCELKRRSTCSPKGLLARRAQVARQVSRMQTPYQLICPKRRWVGSMVFSNFSPHPHSLSPGVSKGERWKCQYTA